MEIVKLFYMLENNHLIGISFLGEKEAYFVMLSNCLNIRLVLNEFYYHKKERVLY